jgi:hypothetical protein
MAAKKEGESSSKAENKKKRKEVKVEETIQQSPERKHKKRKRDAEQVGESPLKKHKSEKKEKKDKKEKSKKSKKEKESKPPELEIDVNLPAPPSKKALRLQKKGKPVPPVAETSQPPTSNEPKVDDSVHPDRKNLIKKEPPRAEFCVWIGNLAYSTDVDGLRTWLTHGLAKVDDDEITRVNLPVNATGQSKGYFESMSVVDGRFAYVDLKTQEGRDTIITRSEQVLDGRRLLIKNGNDFTGRPTEKKPRYHVQTTTTTQQGPKMFKKEFEGQESRAGNFGRKFQGKGEKVKNEGGRVGD